MHLIGPLTGSISLQRLRAMITVHRG